MNNIFKLGTNALWPYFHVLMYRAPCLLFAGFLIHTFSFKTDCFGEEWWSPSVSYQDVVDRAKQGSPYYQGLLGIYLRSGEAGCVVNLDLSKQWSQASAGKGHPFGSYNLANLAMLEGDFETATHLYQDAALLLQRRASDGDPVSMYCMGEIDFQVIPTNVPRALDLFIKAADAGYPQAQATIGALYLKGLPGLLDKDHKKGITLLSKAVHSKSLTARFNLGMAYYNGDGVSKDSLKASQWLRIAERQNFSEAQYTLGLLLLEGSGGITKNTSEGLALLRKAAGQDHQLANLYLKKREGRSDPSSSQPRISKEITPKPYPTDDRSTLERARQYYTGVGKTKDYDTAYGLFLPLAQGGNAEAARFVGLMKLTGKGTARDTTSARQWLSIAAQKGDRVAIRLLEEYKALF
jgi:TPR repeat protein